MAETLQHNEILMLMVTGILVMLTLALAFVLFFNQSRKKILQQQMDGQQKELEHQQRLLHRTILTQEEERKRIAKELHDEIGSKLNVILLHTHRLNKTAQAGQDLRPIVAEVKEIVNTTIDTSRRISHDLLPPTLENFGLLEAIKELCEQYQKTEAIEVVLEICQNERKQMDKLFELHLFRILQELMNNTLKYAEASQIGLKVWLGTSQIKLEYRDNGKGFDWENSEHHKGLGLQNIKSRMKMLEGTYHFFTARGKGVVVTIEKSLV